MSGIRGSPCFPVGHKAFFPFSEKTRILNVPIKIFLYFINILFPQKLVFF